MQFVSMREFTASPKETQAKLVAHKELVVTNNGTPTMLVIDIANKDFLRLLDYLRRQEALDILHEAQIQSVRNGTDTLTMVRLTLKLHFTARKRGMNNESRFRYQYCSVSVLISRRKTSRNLAVTPSLITLPDETDRKFYDVAKASRCYLITGNKKHFPNESFIVSPSEYLEYFFKE